MVIGDMEIASTSTKVAKGMLEKVKAVKDGAKALISKVNPWGENEPKNEDGSSKCVGLSMDKRWGSTKATGATGGESDGVQGCDDKFWHKPHTSNGERSYLEWGVVDEAVFVNQPVGDGGRLVPTVDAGVQMYGGTICGTSSPTEKAGETRCFQYAMPLSFVSPNSAEDEECPCAKPGTFPFFNCEKNAKQFFLHVSTMPGSKAMRKAKQVSGPRKCKSLPIDPGVLYFYQKSLTAHFESKKTDVSVRSCPSTDIMT